MEKLDKSPSHLISFALTHWASFSIYRVNPPPPTHPHAKAIFFTFHIRFITVHVSLSMHCRLGIRCSFKHSGRKAINYHSRLGGFYLSVAALLVKTKASTCDNSSGYFLVFTIITPRNILIAALLPSPLEFSS